MSKTIQFRGRIGVARATDIARETNDPELFRAHLERFGLKHPALTQPHMGRLSKKARAVRFEPDETSGRFRLGAEVELVLFANPWSTSTYVTGQVWSLAPDAGVWVATGEGFYYVHRKDGAVKKYADRREQVIGRVA